MQAIITVQFDPSETAACQRVIDSITVAYPDYHAQDAASQPDFPFLRAATATARRGSDLHWDLLSKAVVVFQRQLAVCREQSDGKYWERTALTTREPVAAGAGGVALFSDPVGMCTVLAELRTGQAQDAGHALRLVSRALAMASPPEKDK